MMRYWSLINGISVFSKSLRGSAKRYPSGRMAALFRLTFTDLAGPLDEGLLRQKKVLKIDWAVPKGVRRLTRKNIPRPEILIGVRKNIPFFGYESALSG